MKMLVVVIVIYFVRRWLAYLGSEVVQQIK